MARTIRGRFAGSARDLAQQCANLSRSSTRLSLKARVGVMSCFSFACGVLHHPRCLAMGASHDPSAALAYFSFITLTTVGYGDITPVWPGAGGLAAAEAIVANSISR